MASIRSDVVIAARPEAVWDALRDVGAIHERLVRGFVVDCVLEGNARTVTLNEPGPTVKRQLVKSATSIASNYRASRRARSHAEFTARIGVVAEEADESYFWLRIINKSALSASAELPRLVKESDELTAIFSKMVGTARRNERRRKDGDGGQNDRPKD